MVKDEVIQISLKSAREWDAKQNPVWASNNYSAALIAILSKSLIECENPETGMRLLASLGAAPCLQDVHRSLGQLKAEISAGKRPWSCIGGNYNLTVLSHVATLLGEPVISTELLDLANQPEVISLSTKFWALYSHGLRSFHRNEAFEVTTLKLKGLERYWIHYVHLMEKMARKEDISECLKSIDAAFEARNQDGRINDDSYEIEGSRQQRVRWDFRKAALLADKSA